MDIFANPACNSKRCEEKNGKSQWEGNSEGMGGVLALQIAIASLGGPGMIRKENNCNKIKTTDMSCDGFNGKNRGKPATVKVKRLFNAKGDKFGKK